MGDGKTPHLLRILNFTTATFYRVSDGTKVYIPSLIPEWVGQAVVVSIDGLPQREADISEMPVWEKHGVI